MIVVPLEPLRIDHTRLFARPQRHELVSRPRAHSPREGLAGGAGHVVEEELSLVITADLLGDAQRRIPESNKWFVQSPG